MKESYKNVIGTRFELGSTWKRKRFFGWEKIIQGFPGCKKLSKGALYENTGHLIYDSIRKGGVFGDYVLSNAPIVIDPEYKVSRVFEGNTAFLGNIYSQYGHFITEGLSRLFDFKELNEYDQLVMYPFIFDNHKADLKPYHIFFYDQLGIDHKKIQFIHEPCRFDEVTVYKQLWTLNDQVDPRLGSLYEYLRSLDPDKKVSGSKFFLSRRKSARIDNLDEVEEVFSKQSFQILYPEELPLAEQMAIYKGNNLIVSLSGSAMHNTMFGRANSKFIELGDERTPHAPHIMQQLVNSLSICDYSFLPFVSRENRKWDIKELEKEISKL